MRQSLEPKQNPTHAVLDDDALETVSGGSGATAPSFRLEAGDGGFYICGPAGEEYEYVKDEPPTAADTSPPPPPGTFSMWAWAAGGSTPAFITTTSLSL